MINAPQENIHLPLSLHKAQEVFSLAEQQIGQGFIIECNILEQTITVCENKETVAYVLDVDVFRSPGHTRSIDNFFAWIQSEGSVPTITQRILRSVEHYLS
mgnify:CR=1 FL=1